MIDEAFDTELEDRLRAALDEMIPKLVASEIAVGEGAETTADVRLTRRVTPARGSRRLVVAALAVAATVLGLIVIAGRDTGEVVPGESSSATDAGPQAWYDLIAPSLPERFPYVALTFATDVQLWFVALSPADGKSLEIQLASGGYSAEPTTTVDTTGEWVESAQGWSVRTPAGLFVSVTCDIGVGGRNYVGPENSCDKSSGLPAYTKDEIRAVATALATSLTPSIFDQDLGTPVGDSIDTTAATAMISAALVGPGQQVTESNMGNGSDYIYNIGLQGEAPFDTAVATDHPAAAVSIRILHGLYPSATVPDGSEVISAVYEDAALVWMFGTRGAAVRISTTDPSPASVAHLAQLARDLVNLDPKATQVGPTATTIAVPVTTTTLEHTVSDTPAGATTTTLGACGPSNTPPLVVVVNASHVINTASWWTDLLAANVPAVSLADPVSAIAQMPASRVMALDGFECSAALVSHFTTGTAVELATLQTIQALVSGTLPTGTSIVVFIGDDNLSNATTGVTTTSVS